MLRFYDFLTLNFAGLLIVGAVVIMLGGCTNSLPVVTIAPAATTDNAQGSIADLRAFTLADLQNAEADAKATGDIIAEPCYAALADVLASLPAAPGGGQAAGAATAFQHARDLYNPLRGGIPPALILGCGPLASQVRLDVIQFIGKVAGGAAVVGASGGILAPLGPLIAQ